MILDPKFEALQKLSKEDDDVEEIVPQCLLKDMQAGFTVLPSHGLNLQLVERI